MYTTTKQAAKYVCGNSIVEVKWCHSNASDIFIIDDEAKDIR